MEIAVATLIHFVVPASGLCLYLRLRNRMLKAGIPDPPIVPFFVIFATYGGWLLLILTALFWVASGMATLGLAYLMFIAPVVMLALAIRLYKRRNLSAFHFSAFVACAAYILFPISLVIFRSVMVAKMSGAMLQEHKAMNKLLDTDALELSGVVANSAMNRERVCVGKNSYARDLSFDPLDFLKSRLENQGQASWIDLCCGRGRALIEAAERLAPYSSISNLKLLGIDLVAMFDSYSPTLSFIRLQESSVSSWRSGCPFDLITCVHGLHYVGDKLGLIQNAVSWLKEDGIFLANLDPDNLKLPNGANAGNKIIRDLRKIGFEYQARKHLIICKGRKDFTLNYRYLGADDGAGPNYTGQAAVNLHYDQLEDLCPL